MSINKLGLSRYGFTRGERGWGTGPSTDFTDFQQNPRNDIEEITADMVLNWVYRRDNEQLT